MELARKSVHERDVARGERSRARCSSRGKSEMFTSEM